MKHLAILPCLLAAGATLACTDRTPTQPLDPPSAALAHIPGSGQATPSGERILGQSVLEGVYDYEHAGAIGYVSTPMHAPLKANPHSWAPFYLVVYPTSSSVAAGSPAAAIGHRSLAISRAPPIRWTGFQNLNRIDVTLGRSPNMSGVRVLVGTRKGAFVLTADGKRVKWAVSGPHFAGWEIYHLKGSPVDPDRIYASQSSAWFGQVIQRSCDGGKTWETPGGGMTMTPGGMPAGESNRFVYDVSPETGKPLTTHQWYDGTQHPWEFKRVWHLEPSLTEPDVAYAGVEDAALFRTDDGAMTWRELAGLRGHGTGPKWQPGAGGMCLHTILLAPDDPRRIYVAISAAGAFRSDDGGLTWKPINRGLHSQYIPEPTAEVGHCVHRIALNRSRPNVLFMQKHWDVMRSDDAGDSWREVSGNLPTDFGFAIDVHAHEPETIYVVPIKSDSEHYPLKGRLRVYRSRAGGNEWEPLTKGLPQRNCYVNVLRDAMAVDSLDSCGVYFGTTGGQVYMSPDGGDSWKPIVRDLPAVLSVEVQTLP